MVGFAHGRRMPTAQETTRAYHQDQDAGDRHFTRREWGLARGRYSDALTGRRRITNDRHRGVLDQGHAGAIAYLERRIRDCDANSAAAPVHGPAVIAGGGAGGAPLAPPAALPVALPVAVPPVAVFPVAVPAVVVPPVIVPPAAVAAAPAAAIPPPRSYASVVAAARR